MARETFVGRLRAGAEMPEAVRAEADWRRRMGLMRVLLPAAALVLVAAVVGWPLIDGGRDSLFSDTVPSDLAATGREEAVQPRFESTDSSQRPYVVDAESAWQRSPEDARVFLTRPEARMTGSDGGWISVAAQSGVLDRGSEILTLSGGVDAHTESGLQVRTSSARFDMRAGTASTQDPVRGHGPWGELDATGCTWRSEGGLLRCGGRPTLVLYPQAFEEGEG